MPFRLQTLDKKEKKKTREKKKYFLYIWVSKLTKMTKYDFFQYSFLALWVSKKSVYWKFIKRCLPLNNKHIPFIIYDDICPKCFLNIDNKNIHFVLGDGDNV